MGKAGFSDAVAVEGVGGAGGLKVHGLPEGTAFDVGGLEPGGELVAVAAVGGGIDEDGAQPEVRVEVRPGVLLHADAGDVGELLGVDPVDAAAVLHEAFDACQLPAADAGADVAQAIVVADAGVPILVVGVRVPRLGGVEFDAGSGLGAGADEGAAAGGGDHLVAVEGEGSVAAEGAAAAALVVGAEGLTGVFEHGNPILVGDGHDGVNVGRHAVEVDGDDGFGHAAPLGEAVEDGLLEQVGVHIPAVGGAVDEHGGGAEVGDGVDGGGEGEALADDFVAEADAEHDEAEVDGGGACAEGDDVFGAHEGPEFALEGVDVRPQRDDPVGVEGLLDVLLFPAGHFGQRKPDAIVHDVSC